MNRAVAPDARRSATTGAAPRRRRLVMIVRDYPPANTPATLRALGFARYLPEFGWDASVVTMRVARDARDPSLLRQVPDEASVYRAFGFDSKDVFSVGGRYPRLLALPDRNVSWLPAGVVQALRAVRQGRADALLSSGPPLTAHCIAHVVQRITKLPWIADIRDLWDGPPSHARLSHSVEHRLACHLLRASDRLTVVTEEIAEGLRRSYDVEIAPKTHILPNGFDEAVFEGLVPSAPGSGRFTIAHVGFLSSDYRNPQPFLAALRGCLDRGELPQDTLVSFVGADAGTVLPMGRTLGLGDVVRVRERVPYLEAMREMCDASALLLLQGEEFRHAVPSKAYEYLRSGRPIVALATPGGESARLLAPFAGVFTAAPDQPTEVAACLRAAYHAWRDRSVFARSGAQMTAHTRRSVAGELAEILERIRAPDAGERRGSV